MTFSEKLALAMHEKGISTRRLSGLTGIPKSAIQRYTSGDTEKIPIDRMKAMAEALSIDPAYIMGWATEEEQPPAVRPLPSNLRPVSDLHRQRVPMIGKVAAGQPIMAETDYETFIDAPLDCDAALEVKGDSMVPTYLDGDILYIKHRPDVPDGQIAVVLLDDEATLKHVYHDPDGLTLLSDNHDYAPIRAHSDTYDYIAIYGVPVGYTRIYKKPVRKPRRGI